MAARIVCECSAQLNVANLPAGTKARCPKCGTVLPAPGDAGSEAPAPKRPRESDPEAGSAVVAAQPSKRRRYADPLTGVHELPFDPNEPESPGDQMARRERLRERKKRGPASTTRSSRSAVRPATPALKGRTTARGRSSG